MGKVRTGYDDNIGLYRLHHSVKMVIHRYMPAFRAQQFSPNTVGVIHTAESYRILPFV